VPPRVRDRLGASRLWKPPRNTIAIVYPGKLKRFPGTHGAGYEYGGGLNWYPYGNRDCRLTAEVLQISDSPAQNLLTGYRAGASGTLIQLQWMLDL
jgi:hypothetical protein